MTKGTFQCTNSEYSLADLLGWCSESHLNLQILTFQLFPYLRCFSPSSTASLTSFILRSWRVIMTSHNQRNARVSKVQSNKQSADRVSHYLTDLTKRGSFYLADRRCRILPIDHGQRHSGCSVRSGSYSKTSSGHRECTCRD